MAPSSFRRTILACAALAICARVAIAVASWNSLTGMDEAWALVGRAYETMGALESVRSAMDEKDQRRSRQELARAWALAANEPVLRERLDAVALALDAKSQKGGRDALAAARAEVLVLLEKRTRAQREGAARAFQGIIAAAVLSILILAAFAAWLLAAFENRVAERDALRP